MPRTQRLRSCLLVFLAATSVGYTQVSQADSAKSTLRLDDVFDLEYASDPQISPAGQFVAYVRNSMDIMTDRRQSNLWMVRTDGTEHRPITEGSQPKSSPRWSPDGTRLLYVSKAGESAQIFCRWMDSGVTAKLTNLTDTPVDVVWSPDGQQIAFSLLVRDQREPLIKMPAKPEGAKWAEPAKVIRSIRYRDDGAGYRKEGTHHLFVLPAEGGTPSQLTSGDFDHNGTPVWSRDGKALLFSANRDPDWELDPLESEIYEVSLGDREIRQLTDRKGPDYSAIVSPDNSTIAYLGFDDHQQGYQITRLYVMNRDGSDRRVLSSELDRDVQAPVWRDDGQSLLFHYDDLGDSKIGQIRLNGQIQLLADHVGGMTIGRPYSAGSFSAARDGTVAFTETDPYHPADVAVARLGSEPQRITSLNSDVLDKKKLAGVEEIWFESSHDQRRVQGWIVKPPDFDPSRKYPLILEIHGGPFANYGIRFSAELQLYAAAGYVVLYVNPRGSTSYGHEFGNLIHHNYPGEDYDDLMSGVDTVIQRGYIDDEQLFVTGGSGGGVLTSWIVGKTDRFRAAVAAKPVINWYSFSLTADAYPFFYKYWFPGYPWEHAEHYLKRSPLSLVGNVTTPTMLLTGESDYRTPISESEQFYQALKLRKIETALVRIPDASHQISARPSQLIAKVSYVLAWFDQHRNDGPQE